jgi:replicative DNA helicase
MKPPSIIEAEFSLLGGLVFDNRRIDAVADILAPEDFGDTFFGHVYGLIISEYSQGRAANPITLRPLLMDTPGFEEAGGLQILANMAMSESLATPPIDTARMIARQAKRRRLVEGLEASAALAVAGQASVEEIVDAADAAIVTATHDAASAIELTAADCVGKLLTSFNQPRKGVKCTSIKPMDDLLGPIRKKQLVILAARPGMGKTATAISYAIGAAAGGHGVMFVSLEMSGEELAGRMAGDLSFNGRSGVPLDDILADEPTQTTVRAVQNAMGMLDDMPLSIVDTGKLTIGRLGMMVRRQARRMAAKGQELELVVIDYLQLLSSDTKGRSAYEAVSEISRGLKAIAKDSGVGILALAQLSREVEKRTDRRPQLSDLRDSGQIEQDADAVVFLVREEYYLRQNEPDQNSALRMDWEAAMAAVENELEFVCAKRRNGRTGSAKGHFYTRFQAVRG